MSKLKVTVFGSFVVDLMSRADHLPVAGETVMGNMFKLGPGGKGFNQGVAAHKAGCQVNMVTRLGDDIFGKVATDAMEAIGLDSSHVIISEGDETGAALIMVDEESGQNMIIVVSGACGKFTEEEVEKLQPLIDESTYLLTQLETNISAIEQVIGMAKASGVKVIFNPAPIQPVSDELLAKVDIITPNEVEAEQLTGIVVDSEEAANKAAQWFHRKGIEQVVITLGARGVFVSAGGQSQMIPAYKVEAIDTTGAGDAFNGGLLTALAEGQDIWQAVQFANALAALSVQKLGTSVAMPTRAEIDRFLEEVS